MTDYCPFCDKGVKDPCEHCGTPWDMKEKLDETFEIISEKEKYWKGQLEAAETSFITAQANMKIAQGVITLSETEISTEAKKNAK